MKIFWLAFLMLSACASVSSNAQTEINPYEILRNAYSVRNSERASQAYTQDAVVTYLYDEEEIYIGRDEIKRSFDTFFNRIKPSDTLDLNFRINERRIEGDLLFESGFYRLRFGNLAASFGTFDVVRSTSSGGMFAADTSKTATAAEYDAAKMPEMFPS